jgi:hypothetical protein
MSTGGDIGFHLAATHPGTFGHIVILAAGYEEIVRGGDVIAGLWLGRRRRS